MAKPGERPSAPRRERQTIRFRTATGSVYEITRGPAGMRWQRISATFASGVLRNEGARLVAWPDVRLGERCRLLSEPLAPPHPRLVWTTEVVAILGEEGEPVIDTPPASYRALKPGDVVIRLIAGSIPMKLIVSDVDERFIYCGGPAGWKFDRNNGAEVVEEIGWGPESGITGSYLLPSPESASEEAT
jgi:hypothetical protein